MNDKFGSEVFRSMASISVTFLVFYLITEYFLFHETVGVNNSIVVVFSPNGFIRPTNKYFGWRLMGHFYCTVHQIIFVQTGQE